MNNTIIDNNVNIILYNNSGILIKQLNNNIIN